MAYIHMAYWSHIFVLKNANVSFRTKRRYAESPWAQRKVISLKTIFTFNTINWPSVKEALRSLERRQRISANEIEYPISNNRD